MEPRIKTRGPIPGAFNFDPHPTKSQGKARLLAIPPGPTKYS